MKIRILAVGQKMPAWVNEGVTTYLKRFPREYRLEIQEIPAGQRGKNADLAQAMKREAEAILARIDADEHVIALEVKGQAWSTQALADQFEHWHMQGQNLVFLIGGPEGLDASCRQRANQLWSLSNLTLPHPLVRVLLAEQLYRAWSITQGHPYHR